MGHSSGARPRKAVAKEVNALKARLATVQSHQWQKAQCIFDEIVALCEVRGPSGGQMVPRACRFCGFYGHSRQYCVALKEAAARREEYWKATEVAESDALHAQMPTQGTVSAKQWQQILEIRWRLHQRAHGLGSSSRGRRGRRRRRSSDL